MPQSSWAEHSLEGVVGKKEQCALRALGCKGCTVTPVGGFLAGYPGIRDSKGTEGHLSLAVDYHLRTDPPKSAWVGKLFGETSGLSSKCISFSFSFFSFCYFIL